MYPKVVAPPVKINRKKVILGAANMKAVEFPVPKVLKFFLNTFLMNEPCPCLLLIIRQLH